MSQKDFLVEDFDYNLPPELIAQEPVAERDSCRLLVLDKVSGRLDHRYFFDLKELLVAGDVLVLNESKVFPARLVGHKKESGGEVEIFLQRRVLSGEFVKAENSNVWEAMSRGRLKIGSEIVFAGGLEARFLEKKDNLCLVSFNLPFKGFFALLDKIGQVPLPPYIKRPEPEKNSSDKNDYQTVFASDNQIGSVAAPTAGLHFTDSLLKELAAYGVIIAKISLHVGLGTFAPVKTENIKDHKMHQEFVSFSADEAEKIIKAKKEGRRIIAVGTTACRALESWASGFASYKPLLKKKALDPISFWTDIFIFPGYKFALTDALITNFHLPKSTLLMLVSALAGKKNIDRAYQAAIAEKYRFFSYGDAMFIH